MSNAKQNKQDSNCLIWFFNCQIALHTKIQSDSRDDKIVFKENNTRNPVEKWKKMKKLLFDKKTSDENSREIWKENVDIRQKKITYLEMKLLLWNETVSKNNYEHCSKVK